jgi:hypothetical protein
MNLRCRWIGHAYSVTSTVVPAQPWSRWGVWVQEDWGPCRRCGAQPPEDKPRPEPRSVIWPDTPKPKPAEFYRPHIERDLPSGEDR